MFKNILLGFILFAGLAVHAQPGKPSVHHFVTVDEVPTAAHLGGAKQLVPQDSTFSLNEFSPPVAGELSQNARCKDGRGKWMLFGKANFHRDTLVVSLFRPERENVYQLEIKIWKGEFLTSYKISARNGLSKVIVLATDQVLVLEKIEFNRGDYVTGFINFRGTHWEQPKNARPWGSEMDYVESSFIVSGPFKLLIE